MLLLNTVLVVFRASAMLLSLIATGIP